MNLERFRFGVNSPVLRDKVIDTTTPGGTVEAVGGKVDSEGNFSDSINKWSIDDVVTLCRPDNNPLDTLIRKLGASQSTKSQRFEFWKATQNDGIYTLGAGLSLAKDQATATMTLATGAKDLLVDDVLACELTSGTLGYSYDSKEVASSSANVPVIVKVVGKTSDTVYTVVLVNDSSAMSAAISVASGKKMFRIGNAKSELDVITNVFNLMPVKDANYAQRFMHMVAESDYQSIIDKEAKWGLEQYRNASLYAFRTELELSAFCGIRRRLDFADGERYFTGGCDDFLKGNIISASSTLSFDDVQGWGKEVFADSNGSAERYMFVSPYFMSKILAIPTFTATSGTPMISVVDATDLKGEKLGFTIRKIDTGYGMINLVMHKGLAGRRDKRGYILDITNIRRRVLENTTVEKVDLKEKLIQNAKAYIINECSGLEFQNTDTMAMVDLA